MLEIELSPSLEATVVVAKGQGPIAAEYLRTIFTGKIVAAGGFEPDTAEAVVTKGDADLVAFGRYFVSNPDLPIRIRQRLPLSDYDRSTFYTFDARGYIDHPAYTAGALASASAEMAG
jgi:N-ethylmaleimide reductase